MRLSGVQGQAVPAAVLAPIALGLLLLGAGMPVHGVLDWRLAASDAERQLTEPRWTRRH